ncbi:MAG: EVE domain-containing protein [Phycisphaerales bacterium]
MATFLLKTEPTDYSFADLQRDKSTLWTGVANPAALIALRSIRKGDELFIYHTGDEKAIVGLARAAGDPQEDPKQPGRTDKGEPKFACVKIEPVKPAPTPVTLAAIKADARFKEFLLVRQGRLSVMAVPPALDKALRKLAGL